MAISQLLLIGVFLACLGEVVHIVGVSTTRWSVLDTEVFVGIFKACGFGTCVSVDTFDVADKFRIVQAMTIIGILCGFVAAGIATVTTVFNLRSKCLPKTAAVVCLMAGLAAGAAIISGTVVFAVTIHSEASEGVDLGYSFYLCNVGAIQIPVGTVLNYVGSKSVLKSKGKESKNGNDSNKTDGQI